MTLPSDEQVRRVARAIAPLIGPHEFDSLPLSNVERRQRQRAGEDVLDTQIEILEISRAAIAAMQSEDVTQ